MTEQKPEEKKNCNLTLRAAISFEGANPNLRPS